MTGPALSKLRGEELVRARQVLAQGNRELTSGTPEEPTMSLTGLVRFDPDDGTPEYQVTDTHGVGYLSLPPGHAHCWYDER